MKMYHAHYIITVRGTLDVQADNLVDAECRALANIPTCPQDSAGYIDTTRTLMSCEETSMLIVTVRCPTCNKPYKQELLSYEVAKLTRQSDGSYIDDIGLWECSDCILKATRL